MGLFLASKDGQPFSTKIPKLLVLGCVSQLRPPSPCCRHCKSLPSWQPPDVGKSKKYRGTNLPKLSPLTGLVAQVSASTDMQLPHNGVCSLKKECFQSLHTDVSLLPG